MELYVDDMIVNSKEDDRHLANLYETFTLLQSYSMKLNLKKCIFGIRSGKFLGFMISRQGIKASPDMVQAVLDMRPPRTIKEVQRLTSCVATLERFMAKSTDRCGVFFRVLRK